MLLSERPLSLLKSAPLFFAAAPAWEDPSGLNRIREKDKQKRRSE